MALFYNRSKMEEKKTVKSELDIRLIQVGSSRFEWIRWGKSTPSMEVTAQVKSNGRMRSG